MERYIRGRFGFISRKEFKNSLIGIIPYSSQERDGSDKMSSLACDAGNFEVHGYGFVVTQDLQCLKT